MFYVLYIFSEKKVGVGGGSGEVGKLSQFPLVELLVFINIQAISTLICLQLDGNRFLMCNYSIFYDTGLNINKTSLSRRVV